MKSFPRAKSLLFIALATALLLLLPYMAMQFTSEVPWGLADFLIAGALIFSAASAAVWSVRRFERPAHKATAVAMVALGFLLLWAELAVGIFS